MQIIKDKQHNFLLHLGRNLVWAIVAILIALIIGMLGYHTFEKQPWVDAFVNAAMILSGMGPLSPLHTVSGKIFAGIYALFSGLFFILILGLIFSPILHRIFYRFKVMTE